ncbi:hypothetical protein KR51_00012650 [Rubidibacter lacunae KORDI 51-2]|uniref:Translocation and assembly module TamB C-terminal domain-containing protein n=1 Tax=Rubidibacter lacunae KORDI 51-2 TaxID=582515 RepID=U5DMU5_9CHRO|nr:translocation/assembly module TamB domain-containing protein [Rubidibacter lacunae]ERN41939.1 hypothetical protein KR51_00012650 [Rubidibacter lacunae KORDI 51-2]
MTVSPQPGPDEHQSAPPPKGRRWLLWTGGVGLSILGGGALAAIYVIETQVSPLVEQTVSNIINRPLEMGAVEGFSLTSIHFGETQLPPTATSATSATVGSVEARFNPWEVITERQLTLHVSLIDPSVLVEQRPDGAWFTTKIVLEEQDTLVEVVLGEVDVFDADVSLIARDTDGRSVDPVDLQVPHVNAVFLDNGTRVDAQVDAHFSEDGKNLGAIALVGEVDVEGKSTTAAIQASDLELSELGRLAPFLPLTVQRGTAEADIEAAVGWADRITVSAEGTVEIADVAVQVDGIPTPVTETNATFLLQGQRARIRELTGRLGEIEAEVGGTVDLNTGYTLTAGIEPVEIAQLLDVVDVELPLPAEGKLDARVQVTGPLENPQVGLEAVNTTPLEIDRVVLSEVRAEVAVDTAARTATLRQLRAVPAAGGEMTGGGQVVLTESGDPKLEFTARVNNVPGAIARAYSEALPNDLGAINANVSVAGVATDLTSLAGSGTAALDLPAGSVTVPQLTLEDSILTASLQVQAVPIAQFVPQLAGQIDPQQTVSGDFDARIDLGSGAIADIDGLATGGLQIAGGRVGLTQVRMQEGMWTATADLSGVQVGRLLPQLPEYARGVIDVTLNASGSLTDLSPESLRAKGSARLDNIAEGTIATNDFRLADGAFSVSVRPEGLQLPAVDPRLSGRAEGEILVRGTLDNLTPDGVRAEGSLELPDGTIGIPEPIATSFRWTGQRLVVDELRSRGLDVSGYAEVDLSQRDALQLLTGFSFDVRATNLDLGQFSTLVSTAIPTPSIRGFASFDGTLSGTLTSPVVRGELAIADFGIERLSFDPQLAGAVEISPNAGIKVDLLGSDPTEADSATAREAGDAREPDRVLLTAAWTPNGRFPIEPDMLLLRVDDAEMRGRRQGGDFAIALDKFPFGVVKNFAPLPPELATQPASGELSGNVTLNFDSLLATGAIDLERPRFSRLVGDRVAAEFTFDGGSLLDGNGQILSATGQLQLDESIFNLQGELTLVPEGLDYIAAVDIERGRLQDVLAAAQIEDFSDLNLDSLDGNFGDAADLAAVQNLNSVCATIAAQTPPPEPSDTVLDLSGGDLELASFSSRSAEPSISRYSCFVAISATIDAEQQAREANPAPPLSTIRGDFEGTIAVSGRVGGSTQVAVVPTDAASNNPNGVLLPQLAVEMDLSGSDWRYGPFYAEEFRAQGNFTDGILTLDAIGVRTGDRVIGARGTLLGESQSAQAVVRNIPIDDVDRLLPLPDGIVSFGGMLDVDINIAGSQSDPSARGSIAIANASFNEKPIQTVEGSFVYNDARADLFVEVLLSESVSPLTVEGSIPYMLPIAVVPPADNRLNLAVRVADDGLALLDVATREQVLWNGGNAEVELDISGPFDVSDIRLDRLKTQGLIALRDASIRIPSILSAEPIANINGDILFDLDRIAIEELTATHSGGQIQILGTLPLFVSSGRETERLEVTLGGVSVEQNLKTLPPIAVSPDDDGPEQPAVGSGQTVPIVLDGLFEGDVRGIVFVGGAAIAPVLSGEVGVSNAQVSLAGAAPVDTDDSNARADDETASVPGPKVQLDALSIVLGDKVFVGVPPLANFLATGDFQVSGSLSATELALRPEGTVTLREGEVNVFSTQFRLDRGVEQTARFEPARGLDPILNVQMSTSVAESTRPLTAADPSATEFNDAPATTFGRLEIVRVRALVDGPASQLLEDGNVNQRVFELSSDPPRTESEIVTLIGGSLFAGGAAVSLANLATTALFGSLQADVARALGLSEFRIFPTLLPQDDEDSNATTLALAAEAGVDLTKASTVSILALLNDDPVLFFSLRYRVGDRIQLRAATDLNDRSQMIAEYQFRF